MIRIIQALLIMGSLLSFNTSSSAQVSPPLALEETENRHWSVIASLGYSDYQTMYQNEGKIILGRMAIAAELMTTTQGTVGVEAGVQNGHHMHVLIPPTNTNLIESSLAQSTIKPMFDLLFTANTDLIGASLLYAQFKGGIAYREWDIANASFLNKSELAGELQAGLGCPLTELTSLNLLYQGVFGGNPRLRIDPFNNLGYIASIPVQHGFLLGLSILS